MRLELLLKQPKALPTVPALALKLIATFEQEEPDLRLMSMDIAADPVLTAKLLKQANSAFFGLSRAVTTAQDAINMLGFTRVRALVLGAIHQHPQGVVGVVGQAHGFS